VPANIRTHPVENDVATGGFRLVESLLPFYPADLARYESEGWRVVSIVVRSEYWYLYLRSEEDGKNEHASRG
jgi:hypothetical protein